MEIKDRTLKQCPFCGGDAAYKEDMRFESQSENFPKWYVECKACNIKTSVATIPIVCEIWNKRVN